jgi:single-strand DNA-binding protein
MNYNMVLLGGNLTREVELRTLPNGGSVAGFGIAVNRKWKDQASGEMREDVTFVDCEAFGKTAENIAKFFAKGKPIFLQGRLKLDQWKDKTDGSNRTKLKVIVDGFEFVGGKGDADDKPADVGYAKPTTAKPTTRTPFAAIPDDTDLPF